MHPTTTIPPTTDITTITETTEILIVEAPRIINPSGDNNLLNENFNNRTGRYLTNTTVPPESDNNPGPTDLFSIKDIIKYLQENTFSSVLTENNKVFSYLQVYVTAFASHNRLTFNDRVSKKNMGPSQQTTVNRNLRGLLSRGINF